MAFDLSDIRAHFPALEKPYIYLDNPAGTQIAQHSLNRITQYLVETNANHGAPFRTSVESDAVIDETRQAMADFLNAPSPDEIVFGHNMTTITLHLSRSLAHRLNPGDTVVVTNLDHDANISPWTLAAQDRGAKIEYVDFDVEDGTLKLDTLEAALEKKPKIVAVGYASNALGTINPVKQITQMAQEAGALVFIDAVQYAPHGPIDVQDIGCDFLVCSSYKFFGPHMGILYGKKEHLEELTAYKVRPSSNEGPEKWETGTQSFEGIAGILGAIEYFEWLGKKYGQDQAERYKEKFSGRALHLKQGMAALRAYEYELSRAMMEAFEKFPSLRLYGLDDPLQIEQRVPTFSIRHESMHPQELAQALADRDVFVWSGNYYACAVTERLDVEDKGGLVRIGPVHYNTLDEIDKFSQALDEIIN